MMHSLLTLFLVFLLSISVKLYEYPCTQHSCVNDGICIPEGSSFRCKCPDEYVGRNCFAVRSPTRNCRVSGPSSCINGGVCNTTNNVFLCECPSTFTGAFCEEDIDECLLSPCRNGAACVNEMGGFQCVCPRGFGGRTCEQRIEVCSTKTCHNGGYCIEGVKGYVCVCPYGYIGKRCQYKRSGTVSEVNITYGQVPVVCAGCSSKIGNGRCDKECDRKECGYDGGECLPHEPSPFEGCSSPNYCARVFRDGVCDNACDTQECLFDGFDCLPTRPQCSDHCMLKKHNGICDKECNKSECDFDGGDCDTVPKNVLSGELSIVVITDPANFISVAPDLMRSLSRVVRVKTRIMRDEYGPIVFLWKDGRTGERLKMTSSNVEKPNSGSSTTANPLVKEGVLVFIEVEPSACVEECFNDVEMVANFIESTKGEFKSKNMSIYSVEGKYRSNNYSSAIKILACVCVTLVAVVLLLEHQQSSRKRKIIENAPVWVPPLELEVENAKRRRVCSKDCGQLGDLNENLIEEPPRRVFVLPKPQKQPVPLSVLHLEADSADPIVTCTSDLVNKRGPLGRTPLMTLARNTSKSDELLLEDLNKLYSAGADLDLCDDYEESAMHMAVSFGRVAFVKRMMELGASPSIRDRTNSTCLHLAARACATSMVSTLLQSDEMRENVDAVDDENRTALMLVAMHDHFDTKIAQMLCDAGAKVDCAGSNDLLTWKARTALHYAAKYNNPKMTAFLLGRGASNNSQDYECNTPLHLAASEGHIEPAKELLKAGASVLLRNDKDQTPYDVALLNNCKNVVALLASADNIRVHLYGNHGEMFSSSSTPTVRCAKLFFIKHGRKIRRAYNSPKSTQSTPSRSNRCYSTSPLNHPGTPHSVSGLVATNPSPHFAAALVTPNTHVPAEHPFSPTGYVSHQPQPTFTPPMEAVVSPSCIGTQVSSASGHVTVMASPAFHDSGFETMRDTRSLWSGVYGISNTAESSQSASWLSSDDVVV